MRIAVVGSGIAGLGAAWSLLHDHHVTLYEADDRLGGHANTLEVPDRGRSVPVDTGFIVYNEPNYPNLARLFEHLGVATEPSDMSFSVSRDGGAFEYQARALGLVAQPANLADRSYRRLIREILRFAREAPRSVAGDGEGTTEEMLDRMGMSERFRTDFLLPVVACIWSSDLDSMLRYPARSMVRFLDNHGLLDVLHRPRWRTVTGGSREYVAKLSAPLASDARLGTSVERIVRLPEGVVVVDATGRSELFDHVVLATHADVSLRILGDDADPREADVLSRFRYADNTAIVHRDPSFMPARRRAWSSWNYLADGPSPGGIGGVSLSYWMNRLQNLETERPVILTLNPARRPADVEHVVRYRHPQFDMAAVAAQARIPSLQGIRRTWYCGSYCGYGFHEDGLRAGLEVAAGLGSPAPWWSTRPAISPVDGARVTIGA